MTTKKVLIVYVFVHLSLMLQKSTTSAQRTTARLVNSLSYRSKSEEGRLDIYIAGKWMTVCDDSFTNISAGVACKSLGFGNTGEFIGNRHGSRTDRSWLAKVNCTGTELRIDECANELLEGNDCTHNHDVSIRCDGTEEYAMRLINSEDSSGNPMEGRLEIYYARVWGTVCDDGFTDVTAKVVCASLGYGYMGTYIAGSHYGAGTGPIWLDNVYCTGGEPSIDKCKHRPWGLHNCNHNKDVSVKCGTAKNFAVRLGNSISHISNPKEGRLEIYYSGSWGTVCDDNFTNTDAVVACASLGFRHTGTFIGNRHGNGTGQIWLKDVVCAGTERNIDECMHSAWGGHNCTHDQDVSISCGITLTLVNSLSSVTNPEEGRLELYYAGEWQTVCNATIPDTSAGSACELLGFGNIGAYVGNRHGAGKGRIWLSEDTHISKNCTHEEDVALRCGNTPDYAVRLINTLVDVSTPVEGRLEVYYVGVWGTVCDDRFTDANARVACASLGFGYSGTFIGNRHGSGTGQIWLDDVSCNGTERNIDFCSRSSLGVHDCSHNQDVSISCGNRILSIRLIDILSSASNPTEGRLEIYYNGSWGTVCDDGFTNSSARVACASLGFGYVGTFIYNRHGSGTGQIWLDYVDCVGNERSIDRCSHDGWGSHYCDHSEDVSISCLVCGKTFYSERGGRISSPNFTMNHLRNLNCAYSIAVPAGHKAVVTLLALNIEPTDDWLTVSCANGEAFNSTSFSESVLPAVLTIISCSLVRIWFHASNDWLRKGFSLDFDITPDCGNTFYSEPKGKISSPHITTRLNYINCNYSIAVPAGHKTVITFLEFSSLYQGYEWVAFLCVDGEAFNSANFSGSVLPSAFSIKSCTLVRIWFYALRVWPGKGFSLDYDVIRDCGKSNYSGITATISSPSYQNPMLYANGINCTYFILVPSTFKAVLTFLAFKTKSPNDWLTVSCAIGEAFDSPRFSGSVLPSAVTIPSCNVVRIWFHADYNMTNTSFSLSYKIIPDENPNTSSNVLVVSVLASLLGLCILFVTTHIIRTNHKTRQAERDRVLSGIQLNTVGTSGQHGIDPTEAKTGETGYEGLRSSGIYEHYDEINTNEYQSINEYSENPCLKQQNDPLYDEIGPTDCI